MPKLDKILLGVLVVVFFLAGFLKLMAVEAEVIMFERIAEFIGFKGLWHMYVIGGIEAIIAIVLIPTFLMEERKPQEPQFVTYTLGLLGILVSMASAIAVHLFIFPGEVIHFLVLAIGVFLIATFLLVNHLWALMATCCE